ncbi:alpha-hydroxy-acid oxidizing protein [Anoxynatronum buryatiense]|uniref:L-lactate oxidase n=1 Tax=Anoxynatronum buryatiense TaxID=489973 RepID=A0AA46AK64_9CLOT|nr:alpha-hydroxy-acid oxidizing protein [Anoxynatronum buryatiense]SMP67797.1 FMN-dependent dehydrogenase, includes L-lactate dehydrogenase and type II isopentenyl diphosphate isomerase [Anoxynatronum buryatiense]
MKYQEIRSQARSILKEKCKVCEDCNGIACRGQVPGVGGKGLGSSFIRNRVMVRETSLNLDTLVPATETDTSVTLFGKKFRFPFFAAPIGALEINYHPSLNDLTYNEHMVAGCREAGIMAFTGDGAKMEYYEGPLKIIQDNEGVGAPTIKPWDNAMALQKIRMAEAHGVTALAMDVDAAGLVLLAMAGTPVYNKSVEELKELCDSTALPMILKGIMTPAGALKALEAGAAGIVVSNHGGRVMDDAPSTIEVLPAIAEAVKGKLTIFIDGGFRSGEDILKALALGADAVLIGRPFAVAAYGGGTEGVRVYAEKIGQELKEAMIMTGCHSLADATPDKCWKR